MSLVGRHIDRYVVEAELDSGGFGTVYRARHTVIGRTVALKILHPSRSDSLSIVERFLREARIVAALSSPHVVQVLDAGMTDDRQLFLAMELLEGASLAQRLARGGPLPVREAVGIARQILAGLAAAHAAGVVHRDLKPANVFLARQADRSEIAKVLDFGISKSRSRGEASVITMTGAVLGTPHYMAPEQLHGARDVDARADLYALAVVLYETLSGRLPYEANGLEHLISQRLSEPPRSLATVAPHVPREVLAIVDRGLARDPDARFRSAQEFDAALAALDARALPATAAPARAIVSPSGRPVTPSMALGDTRATPGDVRSALPTPTAPTPAPGTTTFPTRAISIGVVVLALGGAGLVVAVLIAALASVSTAWWITRAPAPQVLPAPEPAVGPAPAVEPAPAPAVEPAPAPAVVPGPAPPPAPGAIPGAASARTVVDGVVGHADQRALEDLIDRAAPSIDRCRRDVDDEVRVQLFLSPGGAIRMAQPDFNAPHGDESTARCVARALQGAAPLADPAAQGIAVVVSHLPARGRGSR